MSLQASIGILVLSVLVASIAQILLKVSARKEYPSRLREYLNPLVAGGYALLLGSTVLTLLALRRVPLSWSPAIESCSYFFVAILGYFILHEAFPRRRLLGLAVIAAGILVFSL